MKSQDVVQEKYFLYEIIRRTSSEAIRMLFSVAGVIRITIVGPANRGWPLHELHHSCEELANYGHYEQKIKKSTTVFSAGPKL